MAAVTPYDDADLGLLAPVWAGTRAEGLTSDRAWLQAMLDVEVALVRAQAQLGSVPAEVVPVIAEAAVAERFHLRDLALAARAAANPVVALVPRLTAAVADADPVAAEYVHRGATSQDVLDTATMLIAARCLRDLDVGLRRVEAAAARLAARHRDTPMAGRTLGQHAVPVTFGLKAAGWAEAARRAAELLRGVLDRLPVQLGGAAGTLAGYLAYAPPETDPGRYADQLTRAFAEGTGLVAPVLPWHTDRTPIVELASALAIATGTVGKIAADVRVLSRTEVGEVSEPSAEGRGGSSAMPQKRNPVLSALIISAALRVGPLVGALAQAMVAEEERPVGAWHAEWQPLRECLRLAGGATETAAELVEGLEVHPDRMRANLGLTGGLITTERVAAVLAPMLGKAVAKSVVTRASTAVATTGRPLREVIAEQPELAGRLNADELRDLLDPEGYLGAAGAMVDRVLAGRDGSA